ncbi:protoporphyrinogen oxidase [Planctomicrobium sp. SH668]|uniref:protoporphyrinogen oxidase n=1 Tax=Planctomicrobium sp. SH668 TaxID=3448126 RepID=UPI003F5AE6F5
MKNETIVNELPGQNETYSRMGLPLRIAVIGGGITGLSAAHRLIEQAAAHSRKLELTVFEKSHRVGGLFGSEQIGDYLIERGADSFITNKPAGVQLCRRLGLEDQFITTNEQYRKSLILHRGRPVQTPDGFNLIAPAKLWPMLKSPLLSWGGKWRVLQEQFIARKRQDDDESLASFVRRRFGNEMLTNVVQPMVGGIYTSDPEHLSLKATLPRFLEMERRHGSLIRAMKKQARTKKETEEASGARYGLFVSLKNGMQQLIDTLEQRVLEHTQCHSSPEVTSIEFAEQVWKVTTSQGRSKQFDGVVIALPAQVAANLVSSVDAETSHRLNQIHSASSAIVVTAHDLKNIRHPLDAFGMVIPHVENRDILATSFLSRKFDGRAPHGKVIIRTFVGGAMQPEKLDCPDDSLVNTVTRELREIFGVKKEPKIAVVTRYPGGMPQFTVGHLDRVDAIHQNAARIPRLKLAGNYFSGVGVPDCIQSGERAAEELFEILSQH